MLLFRGIGEFFAHMERRTPSTLLLHKISQDLLSPTVLYTRSNHVHGLQLELYYTSTTPKVLFLKTLCVVHQCRKPLQMLYSTGSSQNAEHTFRYVRLPVTLCGLITTLVINSTHILKLLCTRLFHELCAIVSVPTAAFRGIIFPGLP
jgi:hypothetical protein